MILELQKVFSSLILYKSNQAISEMDYEWFLTGENEIIGIKKDELTEKNRQLLQLFLQPYKPVLPIMTDAEKYWYRIIHSNEPVTAPVSSRYRLIYFHFEQHQIDPITFKEATDELFAASMPILWESDHSGILIEENNDEAIFYEQIIDVLMDDLFVKIYFFVGPYINTLSDAPKQYELIIEEANIVRQYTDKAVMNYIDAMPYILVHQIEQETRDDLVNSLLGETLADAELVKTIETFMACNLNITSTAKQLYMHRNSLQYRLDKFTEKTGIDLRQFHQAAAVYLALLAAR